MKELEQIQMGGLVDKRAPCIYSLLSKAEEKRGDFVAAVAYLEKSIEIRKTSSCRNKSTLKDCLLMIVPLYEKVGCHEKAVAACAVYIEYAAHERISTIPRRHPTLLACQRW